MATGENWSRAEVNLIVAAYRGMLVDELEGRRFSKAEINRELQRRLDGRNKGSIEFKFANISSAFISLGMPYVVGYKPRGNYQQLVEVVAAEQAANDDALQVAMRQAAEPAVEPPVPAGGLILVELNDEDRSAPARNAAREGRAPIPRATDWVAIEAQNQRRGRIGEELVVAWEQRRLWEAGAKALSNRVDHIARTKGDGLGYDVSSFELDGTDRLIEVKTTTFGMYTPFAATRNEVAVSGDAADVWHLYRVFNLYRKPSLYIRPGALAEQFHLDPLVYEARLPLQQTRAL